MTCYLDIWLYVYLDPSSRSLLKNKVGKVHERKAFLVLQRQTDAENYNNFALNTKLNTNICDVKFK